MYFLSTPKTTEIACRLERAELYSMERAHHLDARA